MTKTWRVAMASAALLLASCATAGSTSDDDDDDDIIVGPDADPNAPDGTPIGGNIDAGGGICPTSPCDLVQQCGCTSPQVCDLNLTMLGSTACRGVTTPGVEGSGCVALEDCAGGYACIGGACTKHCAIDVDCADIRRKCAVTLVTGSPPTPIPDVLMCSSACDPTDAAAGFCPAGFSCSLGFIDPDGDPESGDETAYATCNEAGTATQGQACAIPSDCAVNHLCIGPAPTTCVRMCTVAPPGAECPIGTTCVGLIPTMLIAGIEYGACV